MTYTEVSSLISGIGLPYAYYQFDEGTAEAPPFICFYYSNSDNMTADNKVYARIDQLVIELYTDEKDFTRESLVEAALAANELVWEKEEDYIDSERMYMVTYTMEVLING